MLQGLPYKAWLDGLAEERLENKRKIYQYNNLQPDAFEKQDMLIKQIFGRTVDNIHIEAPFHCDYGYNIEVGTNFFANHNTVVLDGAKVTFGDNVFVAPNCGFYTAGHPIDVGRRNEGLEYAHPITVGDNVWIGASTHVLPGVTIGNNVVIGAGSVVTRDIPDNTVGSFPVGSHAAARALQ